MNYPIKTQFYGMTETENDYGEVEKTKAVSFTIGSRPVTMNFKDALQGQLSLDGERQYLYVRKTPKTTNVKVGDELILVGVSSKTYQVLAVDPKITDRSEIMFLIDALEGN